MPNLGRITSSIPKNETILIGNHEQSLIEREAFELNTTKYQQYNHTILWENSIIILNETMTLNASTHLIINNSAVEFTPVNVSQIIKLTIGINSQLDIYNSIIYLGGDFEGYGSLIFSEGVVNVINSTFTQLGMNFPNNGFRVLNSQVAIIESIFESGFSGIYFENSDKIKIINSRFQNMTSYGIFGRNSNDISIINCTFKNLEKSDSIGALVFDNCYEISVEDSLFIHFKSYGILIESDEGFWEVYNIWIEENTFQNSQGSGIAVAGINITIVNNSFLDLYREGVYVGGRNILVESNNFTLLNGGIVTFGGSMDPIGWTFSWISNATFSYNYINNVTSFGIKIFNFEFTTIFLIYKNNISNVLAGTAMIFSGNVGGESPSNRSWVIGNIISNTSGYGIARGNWGVEYFQYTSFIKNAFIGCQSGETSFPTTNYYSMIDIQWDDGYFGNYWENFANNAVDEDNNRIGDDFFVVSPEYRQIDHAPLLSLDLLDIQGNIGSTHPSDLVRTKSELKEGNNTLVWSILELNETSIIVWLDGKQMVFEQVDSNITVSLIRLNVGTHNVSLVINYENQTYQDLVWVRILPDELSNFMTNIIILLGVPTFIVFIVFIIIVGIKKQR